MRRIVLTMISAVLAAACADQVTSPVEFGEAEGSFTAKVGGRKESRYIVRLRAPRGKSRSVARSMASSMRFRTDYVYENTISGFAARLAPAQLEALRKHPQVESIEADGIVTITEVQTPVPSWGLDRSDQQNLPLDDSYTYNTSGAGVTFYGLDTGIRSTHQDFTGRMLPGADFVGGGTTEDCNGHGTHTASTAAGSTYGIAKDMNIVPVRVLGCSGSGSTSGVIMGVDWVAENAVLPAVANMSLGGGGTPSLDAAVAAAVSQGIVFVVSAGNSNGDACSPSPAREPTAITVGSTRITDARSGFSNVGTCLDLFAPGSFIPAAWHTSNTATNTISGTSMASPHVAGAAGLYLENHPAALPATVASVITSNATVGVVGNPGSGSPNLLLYTGFISAAPPAPPTVASVVMGTLGNDGWYTSDVSGSWNIDAVGEPITNTVGCADFTVNTDTPGATFECSVTTAGGPASASVTVKRDATDPTGSASLAGPTGDNGWYVGPVTVSWSLADNVSGVATSCPNETSGAEGTGLEFGCVVDDNAGNQATLASPSYMLDSTDPTVTYLNNAGIYGLFDEVDITCSTADHLSGVASDTCADISGPAGSFAPGTNVFSAEATDNAGNVGFGSTSFAVIATFDGLCELVELWVSHKGVANSLCSKLAAAARAEARGNIKARNGSLGAFINEVLGQSGKKVPADKAPILISFANALMS